MPNFLLEIGSEEIPADYLKPVLDQLRKSVPDQFQEGRLPLPGDEIRVTGTPRRIVLFVSDLPECQEEAVEEISGPPCSVAFKDGTPTRAAEGFARSRGVRIEDLVVKETPKGKYVFARKVLPGRPAGEVLSTMIPRIIRSLSFPKSMRWEDSGFRFARPIRWIVALLGDEVIPVEIAGVASGRETRSHPVMHPGTVEIREADFDRYARILEERFVFVDREKRKGRIETALIEHYPWGVLPPEHRALLDEVTDLVEYPGVLEGTFDEKFLRLPESVLVAAMKNHQRYFPITDREGKLLPRFGIVIDRSVEGSEGVREGNERVLRARLEDAAFFFEVDLKHSLDDRRRELKGVLFQEGLGSYFEKTDRLKRLAGLLAGEFGLRDEGRRAAERAAEICKADLVTEMVGEFPELQGVIGAEYAMRGGEPEAVARAIGEHYLPRLSGDPLPGTPVGKVLSIAERLDNLAGCFALGLTPTGGKDPFGLRRQALGLIQILSFAGPRLSLSKVVEVALEGLPDGLRGHPATLNAITGFIRDRLYNYHLENFRYDLIEAAMAVRHDDPLDLFRRLTALDRLKADPLWPALVELGERTYNITKSFEEPWETDSDRLEEPEERNLWEVFREHCGEIRSPLEEAAGIDMAGETEGAAEKEGPEKEEKDVAGLYIQAAKRYAEVFAGPVHRFFDKVFVNVTDEGLRRNRLALIRSINRLLRDGFADLSRIVIRGSGADSGGNEPG
jgi:glycyl-tRNA synthetase beta chain